MMNTQAARAPAARRWSLALIVGACLAAAGIVLASSGGGAAGKPAGPGRASTGSPTGVHTGNAPSVHTGSAAGLHTGSPAVVRAAIIHRLRAQHLNYQWVACVRSGRRFQRVRIVRCNVDFGIDPHVEAYCSVLQGERLLTSEDDPAIPCGPDNAGRIPKLITYG